MGHAESVAYLARRFSMYVFGGVGGDTDVLKVGYVFEQMGNVREGLEMYKVPETEAGDVIKVQIV
jgi:hypothetical protein